MCFRVILLLNQSHLVGDDTPIQSVFQALFIGFRFDLVISSYILLPVFLLTSIPYLFGLTWKWLPKVLLVFSQILFSSAFLVCAIDIPYYDQFFSRFSINAFQWMDSPLFILNMVAEEPTYWFYFIPFLGTSLIFFTILRRVFNDASFSNWKKKKWISSALTILFLGMMLLFMRGRIEQKAPIGIGTAYFSNIFFLNQLGLNPNFTLLKSFLDSRKKENQSVNFMSNEEAIKIVQEYFKISKSPYDDPLLRIAEIDSNRINKKNVVLVIMESMAAYKLKRTWGLENLTPFLDSLTYEGIYFPNTYTAGIHTYNGIFSTLFSYPALFSQQPMKGSSIAKYDGIATSLKKHGYSTQYFCTHDGQFDNVAGFLKLNDFEIIVEKSDYPSNEVKSTLGVPDDYMFRFAVDRLNKVSNLNKPFFATIMTASDHRPYYIPDYFEPENSEPKKQAIEYSDYSIRTFIELASRQSWYDKTLFVFVADHGSPVNINYRLSKDYNHSPLLFFSPNFIERNQVIQSMAGQIDVYPSIMGLLNLSFENKTLGINLFKEQRPYIYFNADDKYGVIDKNWLLVVEQNGFKGLYQYRNSDLKNYISIFPEKGKIMQTFAESNLQVFQYIVNQKNGN
jgi:phosphoglycerol transferase MdoB-like AlkP superfamily enzyme